VGAVASAEATVGGARSGRVRASGKTFRSAGGPFRFRGVTYGTFRPREGDGARFPSRDRIKLDFAAIAAAGFTVVRTYTAPTDDLLELAADCGLRLLAGVFHPDWRYLLGASRRQAARMAGEARAEVRHSARRLAGAEQVLGVLVGNEVPADVVRWVGADKVARLVDELAAVVRDEDPACPVSYANYPTTEYLPLDGLDFLTVNVFLERQPEFRAYLTRLHHLAGDRPLVLGEIGLSAGAGATGERRQARAIDWQLATAIERGVAGTCIFSWTDEWWVGEQPVEGWPFGLTRADRSPRPALAVASRWNRSSVRDLATSWPSLSVVVCAYNAAGTLDECLRHACALDYPDLEVIVVDDGSTDGTAGIARRHQRARLVTIPHAGLSVARNEGLRAARGELVAYLDSDAYPDPDWPYFLALGLDGPTVGGVGGPNVPPPEDPLGAQQVARAPGGPVHVLLTDERAEHIPGCNMAFWKSVAQDAGGFDPVYTAAGDDVDFCWKVLDQGWDIAFHPAALVWHHRRAGLRPYLRQQRGYGRAEALVEARHPNRFTMSGSARWVGRIYNSLTTGTGRQRIYRGLYGTAPFQSVYRAGGYGLDLAHQIGVPVAAALLVFLPLFAVAWFLGVPGAVAAVALATLVGVDAARTRPPRGLRSGRLRFRLGVAALTVLQPLARTEGRLRHRTTARRDRPAPDPLPGPVSRLPGGVLLFPEDRGRAAFTAAAVKLLRHAGLRIVPPSGWEDYDARLVGSTLLHGDLITSSHPIGSVQFRIRRRLRYPPLLALLALAGGLVAVQPVASLAVLGLAVAEALRGAWNTGPFVRRVVGRQGHSAPGG
jgi:glycosyltransferase involved in cell wall biosynthesis